MLSLFELVPTSEKKMVRYEGGQHPANEKLPKEGDNLFRFP